MIMPETVQPKTTTATTINTTSYQNFHQSQYIAINVDGDLHYCISKEKSSKKVSNIISIFFTLLIDIVGAAGGI